MSIISRRMIEGDDYDRSYSQYSSSQPYDDGSMSHDDSSSSGYGSIPIIGPIAKNLFGSIEGDFGSLLNGLGAELNAIDEARRSGLVDDLRSTPGFIGKLGDSLLNNGYYLNNLAEENGQNYGSLNKYKNLSLWDRLTSPQYLMDSRGALADMANGIGSSIPFFALAAVAPELGGARAMSTASGLLGRLGAGRAASVIGSEAAKDLGSYTTKWVALNGPFDAFTNAAGMYDDLKQQGLSDVDIASRINDEFKEELPYDAINEGLFGALSSGKLFGNMFKGNKVARRALGNTLNVPVEMGSEYVQEGMQQRLNNKYEGKPYGSLFNPTDDEIAASAQGAIGALPAALFGAVRGATHKSFIPSTDDHSTIKPMDTVNPSEGEDASWKPNSQTSDDATMAQTVMQNEAVNNIIQQQQAEADQMMSAEPSEPKAESKQSKGKERPAKSGSGYDGVVADATPWLDERMDNGKEGCVEAVTKIGAKSSPFLAKELDNGVLGVEKLVSDAGDRVISYDADKVEAGDIIVYGDNEHVVMADGHGGYVGNSSSLNKVVHEDDYNKMGGLEPTKIIKSDSSYNSSDNSDESNERSSDTASGSVPDDRGGKMAQQIAANTGLPANLIWAQLYHESGNFDSQLAREDHNYAGVKGTDGEYLHFDDDQGFIDYMSNYLPKYKEDGIYDAKNVDEYAAALKHGGYFTADLDEYVNGMKGALSSAGLSSEGQSSDKGEKSADFMINEADSDDDSVKSFYSDFATDLYNSVGNVGEVTDLSNMMDRKGKFRNTAENRQSLADNYADAIQQYITTYNRRNNISQDQQQTTSKPAKSAVKPKAAEPAPSIHTESPALDNLKKRGNELLTAMQKNDIPHNGAAIESTFNSNDIAKIQKAVNYMQGELARNGASVASNITEKRPVILAMSDPATDKASRVEQGNAIRQVAADNQVDLPKGMVLMLNEGQKKAIIAAQERLQNEGISIPAAESIVKGMNTNENNTSNYETIQRPEATQSTGTEENINQNTESRPVEPEAPVSNFEVGQYTHTKTGEILQTATPINHVEDFKALKSKAKEHGGYYSRFAKKFMFDDTESRDAFVHDMNADISVTKDEGKKSKGYTLEQSKRKLKSAYNDYMGAKINLKEFEAKASSVAKDCRDSDKESFNKFSDTAIKAARKNLFARAVKPEAVGDNKDVKDIVSRMKTNTDDSEPKTNTVKATYTDKGGSMRGGVKDGKIDIWMNGLGKKPWSMSVTLDDMKKAMNSSGNGEYGVHNLIEGRLNDSLNDAVRKAYIGREENDSHLGDGSAASDRAVDSAVRVAKELYTKATGEEVESSYEKHKHKSDQSIKDRQDAIRKGVNSPNGMKLSDFANAAGIEHTEAKIANNEVKNDSKKDKEESIFGSVDDADREMYDALGITPEESGNEELSAPAGIENTAAERERLEKELAKELSKISVNPVFNPRVYTLGLKLGMVYIKDGFTTAKKWLAKMHQQFGDSITPWAPAILETIKTWPAGVDFNESHAMAITKAVGARYEHGDTDLASITKEITGRMSAANKSRFTPMIEASYNGIKKFFDMKEEGNHGNERRNESEGESTAPGHRNVESGTVRGTNEIGGEIRNRGNVETGGSESGTQSRNEADHSGTDGETGKSGGRSTEGMGGTDDRTGDGAGRTESPVLNGKKPEEVPGENYHITRVTKLGDGGEKTKYKNNVAAIRLLKQLETEGRRATPSEQDVLAGFNGWGPVKSAFSNDPKWSKENKELHEILTKEEYDAAAKAALNAFYTPLDVIKSIWKGVERLGFKSGRVLDPSMGTGNFFGMMPKEMMAGSNLHGVELDPLTAKIAKQLYQKADIHEGGYEETSLPDNFFDLAISNIPFGSIKLHDPAYEKTSSGEKAGYLIHNYFFAKSIDKVRPGGLLVFITGPGTMQSEAGEAVAVRAELGRKADLIGAIKLPSNTFQQNAGTQITTDVMVFQKRMEHKKPAPYAQKWSDVDETYTRDGGYPTRVPINEYYKKHPENMLGKVTASGMYGSNDRLSLDGEGVDVAKDLQKCLNKMPKEIFEPVRGKQHDTVKADNTFLAEAGTRDHAYLTKDGKAYQNIGGVNTPVPKAKQNLVKDFCQLRSALNSVLRAQIDPKATDTVIAKLRNDLNKVYDSFVAKHGYVNKQTNASYLSDDPMYGQTAAVEKYKKEGKVETASKTDIFSKRTVGAITEATSAASPEDALAVSISQHGRVDIPYMANLLGQTEDDVVKSLEGTLYHDPADSTYKLAEEYLSGNVRLKLAQAEMAAKTDPTYHDNVEALKRVQPADMKETDINAHLGAPWISPEIISDFTAHMVGKKFDVSRDGITGRWSIGKNTWGADQTAMTNKWGSRKMDFRDLLERILGMKDIVVTGTDSEGHKYTDEEATAALNQKAQDIQDEFSKWLWTDEKRKTDLLDTYNKLFNSDVERQYDGSSLTFPGLVSHVREKLYPHQKNAIWRIMQGGNTLIAHCVGAGKTWEMQIAGMEMKRVGICRKPMYVVPNNIVEQFRKEFYETYPNAKLLVLTSKDLPGAKVNDSFDDKLDTTKHKEAGNKKATKTTTESIAKKKERLARRRAALSRIATEDWDGIIISHQMFGNIPMSPESYNEFYKEEVAELEAAIREAKGSEMSKRNVTDLENAKANLEYKLKRDISEDKKEIVIPFEELGVDQIFVDEADKFKNLVFHTSMGRLSGVSTTGSKRSMDMFVKTRYLSRMRNGHGVVFATGTPISNTMNEMYTMQRYLSMDKLDDLGLKHFDSWAAMFGSKLAETEPNPSGNGFRMVDKLKFTNLSTLGKLFRSFADIKMPEDIPYLKRPKLKGGQRTVVSVKASNAFKNFKQQLIHRAEAIHSRSVKPTEDNMLKLTSDFRNASLDMRLVDPTISADEAGAKIQSIADVVADRYKNSSDPQGAQLIFSDIGTPKAEKETDKEEVENSNTDDVDAKSVIIYQEIKDNLIRRGIPENEIAFVHDAHNVKQRQELFDKVRNGEIRVFIGSTEMMGAGTNFQDHLIALHHLDCPWKPRDIEQREGRILRAGNKNPEVEIFTYVTEGSFDANMWDKVRYKQQMIDSVMRGDPEADEMDDINSNNSASFGEIEAAAMDNPLMADIVKANAKVTKLQSLARSYNNERRSMEHTLSMLPGQIKEIKQNISRVEKDAKSVTSTRGNDFKIVLDGKTYTKRAEAKAALEKIDKSYKDDASKKVGEIGGLEIHMRHDYTYTVNAGNGVAAHGRNTIQLVGKSSYPISGVSLEAMENVINGGIDKRLEGIRSELSSHESRQKGIKQQLKEPFKQQKELNDALAEQTRIKKELDDLQNKKSEQDSQAPNHSNDHIIVGTIPDDGTTSAPKYTTGDNRYNNRALEKAWANAEIIPDHELSSQQKAIAEFGRKMGVPVRFFRGNTGPIRGRYANGVTYLKANPSTGLSFVFWHEAFHWMKAGNPDIYAKIVNHIKSRTDDAYWSKQIAEYQKARPGLNADDAVEEMLADSMVDVYRRVPMLKQLGRENSSLAQRVIGWIKDMMDRFHEFFHTPAAGLTTSQRDSMARAFGALARDIVDAEGRPVFRVAGNGKHITTATGMPLTDEKLSLDNSDIKGDNEHENMIPDRKERIFSDVIKRMNGRFDYLSRSGKSSEYISKEFTDENSNSRDISLKTFKVYYNQFASPQANKRNLVERIRKIKGLSDNEIEQNFESFKQAAKEMLDYAGFIYKEASSYGRGSDGRFTGLSSWQEAEQSNANHGGAYGTEETKNSLTDKHSDDQGAFSMPKYSAEAPHSFVKTAAGKLGKKLHIKAEKVMVEEDKRIFVEKNKAQKKETLGTVSKIFASPSRIAERLATFRQFYQMGSRAYDVLTEKRSEFQRKLDSAFSLVSSKEDMQALNDILVNGDAEAKEWTKEDLINDGEKENVAEAYVKIRRLMVKAYKMVNEARRRPQIHTINNVSEKKMQDLRDNSFVDILRTSTDGDGNRVVTYKEYGNYEHEEVVGGDTKNWTLHDFHNSMDTDNKQVVSVSHNGDGTATVRIREGIAPLTNLTGYIPHIFHDYMIRVFDEDGNYITTIGSGRTEKEAVKKAEEWDKENKLPEGQQIRISPKAFDFTHLGMDEGQYAAVMGDKDYYKMMQSIAEQNDMTLAEAKEMMKGSVRKKNRHRFLGNTMHRTGVAGYDTNMAYVLRHYLNSASRYYAMETEFKPKAINLYERLFGDFNKKPTDSLMDYIHDYIDDLNGVPSNLEKEINDSLNKSSIWRKYAVSHFGERAALQAASSITNATSYLCLGYLNVSSALLNLTQVMNSAAYIGDVSALAKCIAKGAHHKYSMHDMKILTETNVLNDIGLDSGSGYDMNRMSTKNLLNKINKKGMILFKASEGVVRRGTVLAAYESGINRGMSHDEAIKFAKEVNDKSNFNYGVADAPNIFRRGSIFSQIALQFKKYGIKELEVMADMLSSKTNAKQKAIFWGTYLIACGLMGLPAIDWLNEMMDGKLKPNIQKWIMEASGNSDVGKFIGKAALYGLAAPTIGIDISSRAGLSDVVPTKAKDLIGAAPGKAISLVEDIFNGNGANAIRDVSPGIYNQYAAWMAGKSEGKRGRTNNTYDSFYDKALRSMGFKSTKERVDLDTNIIINNMKKKKTDTRQQAIDDYLDNPTTENAKQLKKLNIKPDVVKKEREKKKMDRLGRTEKGISKKDRAATKAITDFAK